MRYLFQDMDKIQQSNYKKYYETLYPVETVFRWINANSSLRSLGREYAFVYKSKPKHTYASIVNKTKNDEEEVVEEPKSGLIFNRYKSFSESEFLKQHLTANAPLRMELGPCYICTVSKTNKHQMKTPREKEIVFDIDMDEYDEIRRCPCRGEKSMCKTCWIFAEVAMDAVDTVLAEHYGFRDFIWFFSGRRGVHCWVSDQRAKKYLPIQRKGIMECFMPAVVEKSKDEDEEMNMSSSSSSEDEESDEHMDKLIYQTYVNIINMLEDKPKERFKPRLSKLQRKLLDNCYAPRMEELFNKHNLLRDETNREKLLSNFTKKTEAQGVRNAWMEMSASGSNVQSIDYWLKAKEVLCNDEVGYFNAATWLLAPRFDEAVTLDMGHLLKAPFNIHPDTEKICVPIIEKTSFDPDTVPTLSDCIRAMPRTNLLAKYVDWFNARLEYFSKMTIQEQKRFEGKVRRYEKAKYGNNQIKTTVF